MFSEKICMKKLIFISLITIGIFALGSMSILKPIQSFHTESESRFLVSHFLDPVDSTFIFPSSSDCDGCHDQDEEGLALVDHEGKDVNLFDQWRASMMGQSAKDPYWRAKVKQETTTFPGHKDAIENKCISCHAPLGHYSAILRGQESYLMEQLLTDTVGLDGVSCGTCHQISRDRLGRTFSGEITFDTNRVVYGPYLFPFVAPMREFVGFTPKFSEHISSSSICAPCHTLITKTFDQAGEPTEISFVEQATYHEWLNSDYPGRSVSCQTCHMPAIEDSVIISSGYAGLDKRFPYALHTLSGANSMMLKLMKWFQDSLDIELPDRLFDASITATRTLLQSAVELQMIDSWMDKDSMIFQIRLINKAGHKFPSGYPSRRAWVETVVRSDSGDTLLLSGQVNENYSLKHIDTPFEPHWDTIRAQHQVQVYETFMVDIDEMGTTVLDKGYQYTKDNRLPPIGFKMSHQAYDTTQISGRATQDLNFNDIEGEEGSGYDDLFFKVPIIDATELFIDVKLYYQSVPPEWVEELFAIENVQEIDRFEWMYDSIQPVPEMVTSIKDTLAVIMTGTNKIRNNHQPIEMFPNPILAGDYVHINVPGVQPEMVFTYELIDLNGKIILNQPLFGNQFLIPADLQEGVYFVSVQMHDGRRFIEKLMIRSVN